MGRPANGGAGIGIVQGQQVADKTIIGALARPVELRAVCRVESPGRFRSCAGAPCQHARNVGESAALMLGIRRWESTSYTAHRARVGGACCMACLTPVWSMLNPVRWAGCGRIFRGTAILVLARKSGYNMARNCFSIASLQMQTPLPMIIQIRDRQSAKNKNDLTYV